MYNILGLCLFPFDQEVRHMTMYTETHIDRYTTVLASHGFDKNNNNNLSSSLIKIIKIIVSSFEILRFFHLLERC